MKINIKPLSVNKAWKGRRFKTDEYKIWIKEFYCLLPPIKINFKNDLKVEVVFGFSSKASDIDNPLKPLIDVIQKKYKFNDNQIQELFVKKEIVKKGDEFITLKINEI